MTLALVAVTRGAGRVARAPGLLAALFALTLVATVPFAVGLGLDLSRELAASQVPDDRRDGVDGPWLLEYRRQADGVRRTFGPGIIGLAVPLGHISAVLDAEAFHLPPVLLGAVAAYGVLWAFLWGGTLRRLAGAPAGLRGFVAAGRRTFVRLLTLAVMGLGGYAVLYAAHAVLFGPLLEAATEGVAAERTRFAWRLAAYGVFLAPLGAWNAVLDYARIHVVRGGDVAPAAALRWALGFVRRQARAVAPAYAGVTFVFVFLVLAFGVVEMILGGLGFGIWRAAILGHAYLAARLAVRLLFASSALVIYERCAAS